MMSEIARWTTPDGEVVGLYLQGQTIAAHLGPPPRNILDGQLGYIKWNPDNTIWGIGVSAPEYRGTDLALELIGAAFRANPDLMDQDTPDKTCRAAYLAKRVNERYGTHFTEQPDPRRTNDCPGDGCAFHGTGSLDI